MTVTLSCRMSIILLALCCSLVAGMTSTPLRPPMFPLSVRSPYLSTWIKGLDEGISDVMPEFWNGQTLGWTGLLRVEDEVYSFFGATPADISSKPARQLSQSYTATTSSFQFAVRDIVLELIFNNPITPHDYKRQSIPFSYMEVVVSSFKESRKVDLYLDINGAWVSGDGSNIISWEAQTIPPAKKSHVMSNKHKDSAIFSHSVRRTSQQKFTEIGDMAEWGELYWSTDCDHNLTTSTGFSTKHTRKHFARHGNLTNDVDEEFRQINVAEPVFAFAKSFEARKHTQSALFTIGLVQDEALQVNMPDSGYKPARPLYQRYFKHTKDLILWHYNDYKHASHNVFEREVQKESASVSEDYESITTISTLQAIGGTQLVIRENDPHGDPFMFMKEISSDGNMQTSDVMYPAMPFFLYANPMYMVNMLEPLLLHQEAVPVRQPDHTSGSMSADKVVHDMGSSYPNATGHPDGNDEYMPVEECGNNLIMLLATHDALVSQAKSPKDVDFAREWLGRHYEIALQWTQYLIEYGLITELQLSTDDFAGRLANQTNLAVKAIVGIRSMSIIAHITNHTVASGELYTKSENFVQSWLSLSFQDGIPFAKLAYGWPGSWGTLYNLYADRLLDLDLFPAWVYERQEAWYGKVINRFGVPLDSRHTYTKSDWAMFCASMMRDEGLRGRMYGALVDWLGATTVHRPFCDLFETVGGGNAVHLFNNRPVVGGHLAQLALDQMTKGRHAIDRTRKGFGDLARAARQERSKKERSGL